jgi:hypothetical protein
MTLRRKPGLRGLASARRSRAARGWYRRIGALVGVLAVVSAVLFTGSAQKAFAAGPTISGFSPTFGPVGTTVTITGTGFTGATAVLFGTVQSTFTVVSDTAIVAIVPVGTRRSTINVHTPAGKKGSWHQYFKVTPSIGSFSPASGTSGAVVTLTGNGFTGATGVMFNGAAASSFTVNSDSQITTTAPSGVIAGPITVTNTWGAGRSTTTFTVTTAPEFNVTSFGANPNGAGDNTAAFKAAIAAAETAGPGSVVFVPSGTYDFSSGSPASIQLDGTVPIVLAGAGRSTTTLVELTHRKDLLSVKADHTVVQDLTFNTQTFDGGHGIGDGGNYTTVQRVAVLSGTLTFGIYYPGPNGAHPGNSMWDFGNTINDVTLNDQLKGDGFSFSFQRDASISNVVHTGSHITIYADVDTTITNYSYTPGTHGGTSGWVMSSPCVDVTITNFTTNGYGGQIREAGVPSRVNQDVTVNNEQMVGPANTGTKPNGMFIGDVAGLVIENSSLQKVTVQPRYDAQGAAVNTTTTGVTDHDKAGATIAITFL